MTREPKTILIVEDDSSLLKALSEKFEKKGFRILQAMNGEEGITMALGQRPDAILLDIVMPVMDGMVMMEKIRSDEWGKKVPIIFLTNLSSDEEVLQRLIQKSSCHFMNKSENKISEIIEKVNSILAEIS